MNENTKLTAIIIFLLFVIFLIIGGTFAYWQWATSDEQRTLVNSSLTDNAVIYVDDPVEELKNLYPTSDCDINGTSSWTSEITVDNNTGVILATTFKLKVKIEDRNGNIITNDTNEWNTHEYKYYIKYSVTEANGKCSEPLYSGRFDNDTLTFTESEGWYDSELITKRASTGFPDTSGKINSGVSFFADPNKETKHKYKVWAWIDKDYTSVNYGQEITDPLQNAKISVSWSENSGLEQVRKEYEGEAYARYTSSNQTLTFTRSKTPITVGSTYNGKTVTNVYTGFEEKSSSPWIDLSSSVTNIIFEDYIYPVSTAAWFATFSNCSSIDVSKIDTSRVTNMNSMFAYSSFTEIKNMSLWDTSSVTNMGNMFEVAQVTDYSGIENWDTSNVTDMHMMFYGSGGTLDLRNWNVSKVTYYASFDEGANISGPYFGTAYAIYTSSDQTLTFTRSTTPITIGSTYNGKTVTNVYTGFEENSSSPWSGLASSVTNIIFEDYIYPKSTYGWFATFSNCSSIDVSKIDTSRVTNMNGMFAHSRFTEIKNMSLWDTSSVTNMGSMFEYARVTDYSGIENWDTSNVTNMAGMFYGIGTDADLSNWNVCRVTNYEYFSEGTNQPNWGMACP